MNDLTIATSPPGPRRFHGLGVEADAYIFDDTNRACGVGNDDLALLERRLRALRPALARLFVDVAWVNPSLDGVTMEWTQASYANLIRQLRILEGLGTSVNLVLFQPLPAAGADMTPAVRAMLSLLERLRGEEGLHGIRWLTLWNEPDSLFWHDSPLYDRVFGAGARARRPRWDEYVRLNRLAHNELSRRRLAPAVRLLVGDTVWGAPMRMERMRLCVEAFADLDVDYGYHSYNPEDLAFYRGNPDFAYPGMAAEAAAFRALLGPGRTLILWEFNTCGLAGFHSHFAGVGPGGVDQVSSVAGAVEVVAKVLEAAAAGVDGFCLWCLHDMMYCGTQAQGQMLFGLWRYKWQKWLVRPLYHYYAPLVAALRPGVALRPVGGAPAGVHAIVGDSGKARTAVLLNSGSRAVTVCLPWQGPGERRRVRPGRLPAESDLPWNETESADPVGGRLALRLAAQELSVVTGSRGARGARRG